MFLEDNLIQGDAVVDGELLDFDPASRSKEVVRTCSDGTLRDTVLVDVFRRR